MAATTAGARLTEQHRKAQLAIRAAALREALQLWPSLNPVRLDDTAPLWIRLMMALVLRWRGESAHRAQQYYREFRAVETGRVEPFPTPVLADPDPRQLVTSLAVTGPVRVKYLTERGVEPELAGRIALRDVSGAAGRHVLDAGRETVDDLAWADDHAVGWARVTDGDPCAFCAMLSGRGFVYISRATAERTTIRSKKRGPGREYHDGCGCVTEPAFTRGAPLPGRGAEFAKLWNEVARGKPPAEARRAFRRAYERRPASTPAASERRPRRDRVLPPPAPKRDRRRELTAELDGLSKSFAGLRRRKDAGESVDKPYTWQRDRISRLQRELAQLGE